MPESNFEMNNSKHENIRSNKNGLIESKSPASPSKFKKINLNPEKRIKSVMRARPALPLESPSKLPNNFGEKDWDNYGLNDSQKTNVNKINYTTPKKDSALPEIKSF